MLNHLYRRKPTIRIEVNVQGIKVNPEAAAHSKEILVDIGSVGVWRTK